MRDSYEYNEQDLKDLAGRQRFGRGPKKMGDVVSELFARRGYAQTLQADEVADAWREAFGRLARHSRPGNVKRGVLEVYVRDSATLQEVTFQKRALLKKLVSLLPRHKLKDVRFRVGQID